VHSAKSGHEETRGTRRQAHTGLNLKPGAKASDGFRMPWASSYAELRDLLYEHGLFDVRVVPGMTVPLDLSAQFSLRTKAKVECVTAEFPGQTVRTINDPDIFLDRMVYALTCDDPGLAKAPYLSAKSVTYPNKAEIESLEYYIEHFVWGGLRRTDDERPYPYGVYGTPNWFVNRDPARRKAYADSLTNGATARADLSKEHGWRSYDYPHAVMLYFHMYQIAKMYPDMFTYLDAAVYLNRAWMGSSVPGGVTVPRGPWHYDGEIDLGFGGALRMAATIVTNDPTFGWVAYGGVVTDSGKRLLINPRDGVRRRLAIVTQDRALPFADSLARLKVELERDGFAATGDMAIDKSLETITFALENRTGDAHQTGIRLSFPVNAHYGLTVSGTPVALVATGNPDYPWRAEVSVRGGATVVELRRR
jgi:hypothetical protein